jgi:hypothetical protein
MLRSHKEYKGQQLENIYFIILMIFVTVDVESTDATEINCLFKSESTSSEISYDGHTR